MKDITLDGYALPWVKQVKHLGHTLQTDNSMKIDICLKRGAYIGKVNSILQEFYYADSSVLMKLIGSYCCSMYGSNVWDLFSPESQKLYRSYNVTLRTVYGLPRTTHKYLLESISDTPHLFVQLLARYVTFTKSLLHNKSFPVRFMSRVCISDMQTVLGKTNARIVEMLGEPHDINMITAHKVKKTVQYAPIPASESWRIEMIQEMKNILQGGPNVTGLSQEEAEDILKFACTT